VDANEKNIWGIACYFSYNLLKFNKQSFFFHPGDVLLMFHYFLYKLDKSTLLLALGGWLEEKYGLINGAQ